MRIDKKVIAPCIVTASMVGLSGCATIQQGAEAANASADAIKTYEKNVTVIVHETTQNIIKIEDDVNEVIEHTYRMLKRILKTVTGQGTADGNGNMNPNTFQPDGEPQAADQETSDVEAAVGTISVNDNDVVDVTVTHVYYA